MAVLLDMHVRNYHPLGILPPVRSPLRWSTGYHNSQLFKQQQLYLFLVEKLRTPALDTFHNSTPYMGFGFEMLDCLRQTFTLQHKSDIYTNFLGLISLDMGPKDTLDQMVSHIRKYAVVLKAGSVNVPPPLLSMIFMKSLANRYEVLKQNFVVQPKKYIWMSIDCLHQVTSQFTTAAERLLSPSCPHMAGSAAAISKESNNPPPISPSPTPSTINVDDIKQLTKANQIICGRSNHTTDKCSQLLWVGYIVDFNETKAWEKWESIAA